MNNDRKMTFFAPDNFKKGRLHNGKYRTIDVLIMGIAAVFSFFSIILYLTIAKRVNIFFIALIILPAAVAAFLIQPYGIYHNFLVYFMLKIKMMNQNKKYIWEGLRYEEEES